MKLTATVRWALGRLRGVPVGSSKHYYASWSGYRVPLVPRNRISTSEAEELGVMCTADVDDAGRVVELEKWTSDRQELDVSIIEVPQEAPGTTWAFYEAGTIGEPLRLKRRIDVEQALRERRYVKVVFAESRPHSATLVTRRPSFLHRYEYAQDGRLQRWEYQDEAGRRGERVFSKDEEIRPLPTP